MKIRQDSKPTGYPFRLGTTSYIYPDHILPNVQKLKHQVDDIELVLFEVDDADNLPDGAVLAGLQKISVETGLTYTVHLPIDLYFGDADEQVRRQSLLKAEQVIRLTECLTPFAFNLHFEKRDGEGRPVTDIQMWLKQLRRSCDYLCRLVDRPQLLCVEYIHYPLELIQDILEEFDLSVILDVGHMILDGSNYLDYLQTFLARTRVIHLHGVAGEKDHLSLASAEKRHLQLVMTWLWQHNYKNVLTLEVFCPQHFEESLAVVSELWQQAKTE